MKNLSVSNLFIETVKKRQIWFKFLIWIVIFSCGPTPPVPTVAGEKHIIIPRWSKWFEAYTLL